MMLVLRERMQGERDDDGRRATGDGRCPSGNNDWIRIREAFASGKGGYQTLMRALVGPGAGGRDTAILGSVS